MIDPSKGSEFRIALKPLLLLKDELPHYDNNITLFVPVRNNNIETTQFYVENYPSAVIGFGWYVFGKEAFTATAGIRVEYALTDVISADGKAAGYPANPVRVTAFDPYETTNPLSAQLVFEINWGIGYFAKTACAGRKHFFSF